MNQASFTVQLKGILEDNGGLRYARAQTAGKLDTGRIAQLFAGSLRPRVFMTPEIRAHSSYHVGLLMDASGSMRGSKARTAYACAHALTNALLSAGCAVSVAGFNTYYRQYDTRQIARATPASWALYERMHLTSAGGGGRNNDATAVQLMTRHLQRQPETVRLCLVLSDGCPETGRECRDEFRALGVWHDDQEAALKAVAESATRSGVHVVGVGILSDAPREYYARHAIIDDLDKLYPTLLAEVRRVVKRGI